MTNKSINRDLLAQVSLIILAFILYMAKPWESSLYALDSGLHGRLALSITAHGFLPNLPIPSIYEGQPFFNDHPFLMFYLSGWFMRLFGADAWSARFVTSFLGVLTIVAMVRLGKRIFSERVAFLSALILMTTPMYIQFAARFHLDAPMIFFIMLSYYYWLEGKTTKSGLSVGMAVISKSPVGLVMIPAVVLTQLMQRSSSWKKFIPRFTWFFVCAMVPIVLLWLVAYLISGQNLFMDYLQRQVLGTAVNGRGIVHQANYWVFFNDIIPKRYLIWLLITAFAFFRFVVSRRPWSFAISKISPPVLLAFSNALIIIVMISVMKFKMNYYFLPVFGFLAILLAHFIDHSLPSLTERFKTFLMVLAPIAAVLLLVAPIKTGPEMYPAFKRFAAFIQSHGDCHDRVLFIGNAQPYGDQPDYLAEVLFYTNRKYQGSTCQQANEFLSKLNDITWILTSGNAMDECIDGGHLKKFPYRMKMGNQFLLGRYQASSEYIDLTPLHRELRAPEQCSIAPIPKDPYIKL